MQEIRSFNRVHRAASVPDRRYLLCSNRYEIQKAPFEFIWAVFQVDSSTRGPAQEPGFRVADLMTRLVHSPHDRMCAVQPNEMVKWRFFIPARRVLLLSLQLPHTHLVQCCIESLVDFLLHQIFGSRWNWQVHSTYGGGG